MSGLHEVKIMVPPAVMPPRGAEGVVQLLLWLRAGVMALRRRTGVSGGAPAAGAGRGKRWRRSWAAAWRFMGESRAG
jgi:hypothetical protein